MGMGFFVDNNYEIVTIQYKKLQSVLAEVGGFINILMIISGFLVLRF